MLQRKSILTSTTMKRSSKTRVQSNKTSVNIHHSLFFLLWISYILQSSQSSISTKNDLKQGSKRFSFDIQDDSVSVVKRTHADQVKKETKTFGDNHSDQRVSFYLFN